MANKINNAALVAFSLFLGVSTVILAVNAWDTHQVCTAAHTEVTAAERDAHCSKRRVNGES